MNSKKAKKRVDAARPEGQDDDDPLIAAALDKLVGEAGGPAWIEETRGRDRARAERLAGTPVPADLRERILDSVAADLGEEPVPAPASAYGPFVRMAVAVAAMVLIVSSAAFAWYSRVSARFQDQPDFRSAMAYYTSVVPFQLDYQSDHLPGIRQWLRGADAPLPEGIPPALLEKLPLGCKKLDWNGVDVSLICFFEALPGDRIIHLFVAPRDKLGEAAIGDIDTTLRSHGFETRGWVTDGYVCVLVPSKRDMGVAQYVGV